MACVSDVQSCTVQSLSSNISGCSTVLKGFWDLEWGELSREAVCPLCHLDDKQAMVPRLRPLWLPSSSFSDKNYLRLLPVIFACLSFQLLPSLIVTQLGMSDQGSWEKTKASLLAIRLEAVWTQTPERHTEQNNCDNNRSKNQNGAKEGSWAEKGNKGKHISALTILLLSVVPRNYHIT